MNVHRIRRLLRALLPTRSTHAAGAATGGAGSISSDEWQQVQEVFNASLEIDTNERPAFVTRTFADRPALATEVESLLAAHAGVGMLDRPPPDLVSQPEVSSHPVPPTETSLAHGSTIGRYEILDRLGVGGMGVVYSARDVRLERTIALKFLPPHLVADEFAKNRFVIEAQAAAALDHPNICTIHEIGQTDDGQLFLAMPFYDGETLKHRLQAGALPPEQALDLAIQIAHGLASAHGRDIVHRDIKPANLVVTGDGLIRILDFGIAKLRDVSLTSPGVTPGTVSYMSPEQARGEDVDARTDLWSLGVVLYEMLAGERPFRGEHDAIVLNAIQELEPRSIRAERPDVPAALEQVVDRALSKAREKRYGSAREMLQALESARDTPSISGRTPARLDIAAPSSIVPEGERRSATIVACNLSGFDVMVGDLVPSQLELLVGRIREEAADVATRHGGSLNRFAGDAMVLLFGVPIARENDAVRGVRSALELHERIHAIIGTIAHADGPALRLHTGIDTGRVIVHGPAGADGDHSYRITGVAADTAVRLALQAGVDEVWVSPECHHLISAFFETESRDPLTVRGRKQPMVPYRVLGESGFRTRLEAAEKAGLTRHVGRAAELAVLVGLLDTARRGEGQIVTVIGEAGIGKSRLLHEFRGTFTRDVSVLLGRCQSDAISVPYLPFIEIIRAALRLDEVELRSGVSSSDGTLESAVARIREIGTDLEEYIPLYLHLLSIRSSDFPLPKHLQGDMFGLAIREAIAAILTLIARRRPYVVLLEDWHWADEASLAVLKQVAEVAPGHRLLIIVTSRPGFGVEPDVVGPHMRIALRPLDRSSLTTLIESFLHVQSLPEELGALLHERTGGNPFFLEEICLALLEEGAIQIENGAALLTDRLRPLDLPDSVEAVIRARLDRLDRNARDVLRLASVVGREFTSVVLERTVAAGERLPEALEMLKAAGLIQQTQVVPDAMYRFKHILTQEVAYASLLEHQRRDLHGRVGTRIEQYEQHRIDEHLERLAHHFSRAEQWPKAVRYGMRSAERAGALAQFAEALQIFERTQRWLAHLPQASERGDAFLEIMLRQESLCETLGLRARQQQIISELIRLLEPDGDRATLAEVYLRLGDVHTLLRRFDEGEEALQRSLMIRRELGDDPGELKALRSLGLLHWHAGRNAEALTCIADVVAMDRARNDIVALVGDIASIAIVMKALGDEAQAIARLEEGNAIAEQAIAAGSPMASDLRVRHAYILNTLAVLYRDAGDLDGALAHLDHAQTITEVTRLPVYLPFHHTVVANMHFHQGNVEKGLERYRTAVELTRRANYVPGLSQTLRIQGEVLLSLEREDEALPCLEEAADLYAQLEDHENAAHMWAEVGAARQKRGDCADALAAWSKARSIRRQIGDAAGEMRALEGLGAAARDKAPDSSVSLAYYGEALQLAGSLADHAAEGRLRNVIGIMEWNRGEYKEALQHYERGFDIFDMIGNSADAGLMLNSICVTLRSLGRVDDAASRLEDAVALHRETGQRQLEGHALAALGDISAEQGRSATAAEYYQRSLQVRREIGDGRGEGWMLCNLVRCNAGGEPHEMMLRASQLADECGDRELATVCEELLRTAR